MVKVLEDKQDSINDDKMSYKNIFIKDIHVLYIIAFSYVKFLWWCRVDDIVKDLKVPIYRDRKTR